MRTNILLPFQNIPSVKIPGFILGLFFETAVFGRGKFVFFWQECFEG